VGELHEFIKIGVKVGGCPVVGIICFRKPVPPGAGDAY